ncbi:DKNYY domain-containing protein [Aquimarina sp. I32.4]|uniref:DKNYY domain-containing protein n=1 Tax=Aquimarina sp. I32.4 TaxID=2053903 RepID=UPI000CDEB492|nr:DKNYY domain-containing protein [Aquimarina sp. I32.4]
MLKFIKITMCLLLGFILMISCNIKQNTTEDPIIHNTKTVDSIETKENIQVNTINREERMQNIVDRLDSINASLEWKKLRCGLYINKNKEIALQIPFATEIGRTVNYINHIENNESDRLLTDLVDTLSFKHIGSTFYKDKNHIYHYYDMAYGGRFYMYDIADHATFRVLGDHYAKDKNNIYGERAGILEKVDYSTFTSQKGAGPYAKDKYGYYFWDDLIITHKELKNKYHKSNLSVKEFSAWNSNYAQFNKN